MDSFIVITIIVSVALLFAMAASTYKFISQEAANLTVLKNTLAEESNNSGRSSARNVRTSNIGKIVSQRVSGITLGAVNLPRVRVYREPKQPQKEKQIFEVTSDTPLDLPVTAVFLSEKISTSQRPRKQQKGTTYIDQIKQEYPEFSDIFNKK